MILSIVDAALKLGDKLIEDKDLKAELASKTMEQMLASKTYRWIDGLVKLSYASEQIIKGLIRPLGSMVMFGFAVYCSLHGVVLPPMIHELLYGAPLGWGVSRHMEKSKKAGSPKTPDNDFDSYND